MRFDDVEESEERLRRVRDCEGDSERVLDPELEDDDLDRRLGRDGDE